VDIRPTIEARMRGAMGDFTRAERQAASHILSHYPVSALGSITALARAADVSSPTVVRLVQKMGYRGYSEYQTALRTEVEQILIAPLARHGGPAAQDHPMAGFAQTVVGNLQSTLAQIAPQDFRAVADLLSDVARRVVIMGGRLTHAHADYLATLLRVIRADVTHLADVPTDWQQALLDIRAGDVVLLFDIRRYEANVILFAELAAEQGAEVVLITDRWLSPAAAHARLVLACGIEVPSAWDSTASILVLVEALLAHVQGALWQQAEDRLKRLEDSFARTRFFRTPRSGTHAGTKD
jgi:DNA-binding MurR/RpiR family transcriptional regulator